VELVFNTTTVEIHPDCAASLQNIMKVGTYQDVVKFREEYGSPLRMCVLE
jgi:hypothetical protein